MAGKRTVLTSMILLMSCSKKIEARSAREAADALRLFACAADTSAFFQHVDFKTVNRNRTDRQDKPESLILWQAYVEMGVSGELCKTAILEELSGDSVHVRTTAGEKEWSFQERSSDWYLVDVRAVRQGPPPTAAVPPAAQTVTAHQTEVSPLAFKMADLLKPNVKLPKPDETSDGINSYTIDVDGRSLDLSIKRAKKTAWRFDIMLGSRPDFDPNEFGNARLACPEPGAPGYGANTYRLQSGPLASALLQVQYDPQHPKGYQAILCSAEYVRAVRDLPKSWSDCLSR